MTPAQSYGDTPCIGNADLADIPAKTPAAMDNMDLGAVSLIKLDIEGAENQALNGARRLIQTHKPRLAICAYHKPDDFDTLLDTLSSLRNDYRLTLRHYFDSVIYAD